MYLYLHYKQCILLKEKEVQLPQLDLQMYLFGLQLLKKHYIQSFWIALAYAGGYAVGTFVGSGISKRVIKGTVSVQVITKNTKNKVLSALKHSNYAASVVECKGVHREDTNYMIYAQIDNRKLKDFKKMITTLDPSAFITVTENKEILNGYFGK